MKIGSLCSGYGGLEEGVRSVLGGEVAWHSEIDPGARKILEHRYPGVPNLGDMTAVDWASVEPVDVLTGGTPCQDLSAAGKRAGMTQGTRSNLWVAMREAIAQLRPSLVVWENVRGAYSACADSELGSCPGCLDGRESHRPLLRAVGRVLGDLSSLGFDAEWTGIRAADVGAPHGRFRIFLVAWPAADADRLGHERGRLARLGRPGSADGALHAAHPHGDALRKQPVPVAGRGGPTVTGLAGSDVAADSSGHGRLQGWTEPAGQLGRSDAAFGCGALAPDADGAGCGRLEELHAAAEAWEGACHGYDADGLAVAARGVDWGEYAAAIHRWERLLGRPAPMPNEVGKKGQPRLSPAFVEWMQGLPAGWVTDPAIWDGMTNKKGRVLTGRALVDARRNAQLKALGNGVVWQQCAAALRLLLPDMGSVAA